MSEPMSHAEWLKATGMYTPNGRSAELKAVDQALQQYHSTKQLQDKLLLYNAVNNWLKDVPPGALISRPGTQLLDQANAKSGREMVALSYYQHETTRIVQNLFHNRELVWRTGYMSKLANNKWGVTLNVPSGIHNLFKLAKIGRNQILAMQGKPIPDGPTVASKLLNDIIDGVCGETTYQIRNEVMVELGKVIPHFMNELVKSVTPFLGLVTDAGSALWNLKNFIQDETRKSQTSLHSERGLASGTPQDAIQAMIRIIQRESNADLFSASVSLAALCSKLIAMGADAGIATQPVIGYGSSLCKLLNITRVIARDILERDDANAWMSKEELNIKDAFKTCPILGAYYVWCVPTSVLVDEIFNVWGKPREGFDRGSRIPWSDKLKGVLKDHVDPLRKEARGLIQKHRFVIEGMPGMPDVQKQLEVQKPA